MVRKPRGQHDAIRLMPGPPGDYPGRRLGTDGAQWMDGLAHVIRAGSCQRRVLGKKTEPPRPHQLREGHGNIANLRFMVPVENSAWPDPRRRAPAFRHVPHSAGCVRHTARTTAKDSIWIDPLARRRATVSTGKRKFCVPEDAVRFLLAVATKTPHRRLPPPAMTSMKTGMIVLRIPGER